MQLTEDTEEMTMNPPTILGVGRGTEKPKNRTEYPKTRTEPKPKS